MQSIPNPFHLQQDHPVSSSKVIKTSQISYETKPIKETTYMQVPVYEAKYLEVPTEENNIEIDDQEIALLRLMLQEKEIEIDSLRAHVYAIPTVPILTFRREGNEDQEQAFMELQINFQRLLSENKGLWQENQDLKGGLKDAKREKEKKAGAPRPRDDSKKLQELQDLLREKEAIIRDLNEKLEKTPHFEQMIQGFREEIQRLNGVIENNTKTIGQMALELDRISYKNQDLLRNHAILDDKNKILLQENDRLKQELAKSQGFFAQIRGLEEQVKSLSKEKEEKILEIELMERKLKGISELEEKIAVLVQELRRSEDAFKFQSIEFDGLKASFEEVLKSVERFRSKVQELESTILKKSQDFSGLNEELTRSKISYNEFKSSYEERIQSLTREKDAFLNQTKEFQSQIQVLIKERESQKAEIISLRFQNESFSQIIHEKETIYEGQIKHLNGLLSNYEQRILILTKEKGVLESVTGKDWKGQENIYEDRIRQYKQELSILEGRVKDSEEKARNYSNQIQSLSIEINRISTVLREKENYNQGDNGLREIQNKFEGAKREKEFRAKEVNELKVVITNKEYIYEEKIQDLTKNIQGLENNFMKERTKLTEEKAGYLNEIDVLKAKIQTVESLYNERMRENRTHQEQIQLICENKISLYQKEKEILLQEIQAFRERVLYLELQFQEKQQNFQREIMKISSEYESRIHDFAFEKESVSLEKANLDSILKSREFREQNIINKMKIEYEEKHKTFEVDLNKTRNSQANNDRDYEKRYNDKFLVLKSEQQEIIKGFDQKVRTLEKDKELLSRKLMELEEKQRRELYEKEKALEQLKMQISRFPSEKDSFRMDFEREKQGLLNEISLLKTQIVNETQRYTDLDKQSRGFLDDNKGKISGFEVRIYELLQVQKINEGELYRMRNLISTYEQEISMLKSGKESLDSNIDGYKGEIKRLEVRVRQVTEEYEGKMRGKIIEFETNIKKITQERDGYKGDLEKIKRRYEEIEGNYEKLKGEYASLNEKFMLNQKKVSTLGDTNQKYDDLLGNFNRMKEELESANDKIAAYEIKITIFMQISKKYDELLTNHTKVKGEYDELVVKLASLEKKLVISSEISSKYDGLLVNFNRIKVELDSAKDKITTYEREISNLGEISRNFDELTINYNRLKVEFEELKVKLVSMEKKLLISSEISIKYDGLSINFNRIKLELEVANSKISAYEIKIASLEKKLLISSEISRKFDALLVNFNQIKVELDAANDKISAYVIKIENLVQISIKYDELSIDHKKLKDEYEELMVRLASMEEKLLNSSQFSSKYDQLLVKYEELLVKFTEVSAELEASREKLTFYENKIAILSGEVSRLKNQLSGKINECEESKRRVEGLENQFKWSETQLGKYEVQMREMFDKNQYLMLMVVMICAEVDGLRNRYVEKTA